MAGVSRTLSHQSIEVPRVPRQNLLGPGAKPANGMCNEAEGGALYSKVTPDIESIAGPLLLS